MDAVSVGEEPEDQDKEANTDSVRSLSELIKRQPSLASRDDHPSLASRDSQPSLASRDDHPSLASRDSLASVTSASNGVSRTPSDVKVTLDTDASTDNLIAAGVEAPLAHARPPGVPGQGTKPKKSCLKIRVTRVDDSELKLDHRPSYRVRAAAIFCDDHISALKEPDSPPVSPGSLRVRRDSLALAKINIESTSMKKRFQRPPEYKLKLAVAIMFVVIVTSIAVIVHFYYRQLHVMTLARRIVFDDYYRKVVVKRDHDVLVEGQWGMNMEPGIATYDCTLSAQGHHKDADMCLQWSGQGHVLVSELPMAPGAGECYSVSWLVEEGWPEPLDCFSLQGAHWYGGGLVRSQRLSLNNVSVGMAPYLTGSVHGDTWGPVLERMWLSSAGIAIYVDDVTPLHVSVNAPVGENRTDGQLCLHARYRNSPYQNHAGAPPHLRYTICLAAHARAVHALVNITDFDLAAVPGGETLPSEMFRRSAWSTWAFYKADITEATVLKYAEGVAAQAYGHHLLTLDAGWQRWPGDLQFNATRFPNVTGLLERVRLLGFTTSLQVHPYISVHSRLFQEAVDGGYLVMDQSHHAPGLVRWYQGPPGPRWDQGVAAVVDMNNVTEGWWGRHLDELRATLGHAQLGGFRFDMGEVDMLPYLPVFQARYSDPNMYTRAYATIAADRRHGDYPQARAAYRAQHTPLFVRIHDKSSTWGRDNGLQTLIPTAVTLGLLGYPFVMGDAIGGNAFNGTLPSEELYIRWMQVTTFLPVMHFSIPPHHISPRTVQLARTLITLHEEVVYPAISALIRESSYPLVRPLWWDHPADEVALWMEDEFCVGPDLLVAPVLTEGATTRDVYLPAGDWTNPFSRQTHSGPGWLKFEVPLDTVIYFTRKT